MFSRTDCPEGSDVHASTWIRFKSAISSPGRQRPIQASAATQVPDVVKPQIDASEIPIYDSDDADSIEIQKRFIIDYKETRAGRFYDRITDLAGTQFAFLSTVALLVAWAIAGVVLGGPEEWQIFIQDVGSIQCYISDSLLMRQQQNNCRGLLTLIARLQSRNISCKQLLHEMIEKETSKFLRSKNAVEKIPVHEFSNAVDLPVETWFDRISDCVAVACGSFYAFILFWCGIATWAAFGKVLEFSDLWQLYINTAVAVELTFTSMFLQNTRQRHADYLEKCMVSISKADRELELTLRRVTGDTHPNKPFVISEESVTRGARAIDYYADVIGTGIGVVISAVVFGAWIILGEPMKWSSNWWLIIGTYTGMVGFVDGFVLRNVFFRENTSLNKHFDDLIDSDVDMFNILNLRAPETDVINTKSFASRVGTFIGHFCSMSSAVLASVIIDILLLVFATSMKWSETGQLLCNTPTMIIEGSMLLILIEAHNMANTRRRIQFRDILDRRLILNNYINHQMGQVD